MPGLTLIAVGAVLATFCASATAAPIPARNGQIHACYKVRGKAKGTMRVVVGRHCRRGERRLTWSVTGPAGAAGAIGAQGAPGGQGPSGSAGNLGAAGSSGGNGGNSGSGSTVAGLETKVASLRVELDGVEELLEGVDAGDLSGALGKLDGITGTQLSQAVGTLPVVSTLAPKVSGIEDLLEGVSSTDLEGLVNDLPALKTTVSGLNSTVGGLGAKVGSLCTQANQVPGQIDSVGSVVNNLLGGLNGIPLVGNLLGGEVAPDIPDFTCPSS